ncbi:MAG: hypothetical protein NDI77_02615 [Geobacteraceae bacterium]|nr:hypothetical protein [Geobacteraceae bacterium]
MKFSMKSRKALLGGGLLSLVCAWQPSVLSATPPATRESSYTVYSRGLRVGELKTVCSLVPYHEKKALKFEARTRVNANFVVYSYKLDTEEEALVSDEGTVRYRRTTREKDDVCQVEGRLDRGRFLLDIRENGVRRTLAVDRDRYDYTTMECPEITMRREGDEMTLRLLDLETLTVVTRRYRWVKSEEIAVDGQRIRCRVVEFEDPNKKCRRWIRPDEVGAIVVRQDGKGKDGSYSLRMTQLRGGR